MIRRLIKVEGIVQGVGFRPFVFNLAESLNLSGHVLNHARGVDIEIEGPVEGIDDFWQRLTTEAPPLAHITKVEQEQIPSLGPSGFSIHKSEDSGGKTALVAPDSDVCSDCLRELLDPQDRRYRYPFINCTNCGPRFTIIRDVPYDRPNTTMSRFPMCAQCRKEYENPANRRFHAQPVACHDCGPRLAFHNDRFELSASSNPLGAAVELIRRGKVVAVKGLGGYHLAVDALNDAAVMRLRERKKRDEKPFAVMFPSVVALRSFATVGSREQTLLESRAHPITLVEKKYARLLQGAAPGNRFIGAMLPYTPLHHMLMSEGLFGSLVMTSANMSDDPIIYRDEEVFEKLGGIADAYLVHDREIFARADDSIERPMAHGSVIFRRSRGYTPIPIQLDREYPSVLAVGGELKNTFCLIKGSRAFVSQHIGDLKRESVYDSFRSTIESFMRLVDIKKVVAVAHDMHPDYMSSQYALEQEMAPAMAIQHHHAHMASLMAETHQGGEAIGIVFDGTGYGENGGIWGGEFLTGGVDGYKRAGFVSPVPLPGGDKAIKEPWRIALAVLIRLYGENIPTLPLPWLRELDPDTIHNIRRMMAGGLNTPLSHGVGRLFDAASALAGIRPGISFEGQAAMELEMAIEKPVDEGYPVSMVEEDGILTLDFKPSFKALVEDVAAGEPTPLIAARFHQAVVAGAASMAGELRQKTGLERVFLSGGVFQNRYLSDRLGDTLEEMEFTVFRHGRVPPNDGGISLGQAIIAARRILAEKEG
ncbi:MAG: carbamoyltransferase HypF [Nitrospinota bacterium]|nr:carbamoyltransferase HypF [Nitrospinota bacterium]